MPLSCACSYCKQHISFRPKIAEISATLPRCQAGLASMFACIYCLNCSKPSKLLQAKQLLRMICDPFLYMPDAAVRIFHGMMTMTSSASLCGAISISNIVALMYLLSKKFSRSLWQYPHQDCGAAEGYTSASPLAYCQAAPELQIRSSSS